jgi:hypothetical protein
VTVPFEGALIVNLYEVDGCNGCDGADEPPDPPPQETRSAHQTPIRLSSGLRRRPSELLPASMCINSCRFIVNSCQFKYLRAGNIRSFRAWSVIHGEWLKAAGGTTIRWCRRAFSFGGEAVSGRKSP